MMTLYHRRGNGENIRNDDKTEYSWKVGQLENCCPDGYFKVTQKQTLEKISKGNIRSNSFRIDIE